MDKQTYLENADVKTLINQFSMLKQEINSVYDAQLNEFTDSTAVILANQILQELHNRICKHFNIEPTTVSVKPYDFYLHESTQGFYSFKTRQISLGLLTNFKKENCETYLYNYLGDAWCEYHIINLLHETYHHIQMETLKNYVFEAKVPKELETEIKMLNVYFKYELVNNLLEKINPVAQYFLSPLEMPARKFTLNAIQYLVKHKIIENSAQFNNYKNVLVVAEMDIVGNNLNKLLDIKDFWLNNAQPYEKDIENFFGDMENFYTTLNYNGTQTLSEIKNKLNLNKMFFKKEISPVELLALDYDYQVYLKQEDKENFINQVKKNNLISKIYAGNKYYSHLPEFIKNIKNQKFEAEKE